MSIPLVRRCSAALLLALACATRAVALPAAPVPKLLLSGSTQSSVCYLDVVGNNVLQTYSFGTGPCGGILTTNALPTGNGGGGKPEYSRSGFDFAQLGASAGAPSHSRQLLSVQAAAASDAGVAGYQYLTSVLDVSFQLAVDVPAGKAWSVDLASVAQGALATHDDPNPGLASATLEGAIHPFNVTIGPNAYGFDAAGYGTAITTGSGGGTTCLGFAGARSDAGVVSGIGPGSFSVQIVSLLRTYSTGNESAVLFGKDNVLPNVFDIYDDGGPPAFNLLHHTTADNYTANPAASCNGRDATQDGYHLDLTLAYTPDPIDVPPDWQPARFTPLGDLPGGEVASYASAVSTDGTTVVGRSSSSGQLGAASEAFRWDATHGMAALGDLAGGAFDSAANDVSADGTVIVGRSSSTESGSNSSEAFRWDATNEMIGLGDLGGGSFFSEAKGVSANGSIVVGARSGFLDREAFRWDATNGIAALIPFNSQPFTLFANGVSADGGSVVGLAGVFPGMGFELGAFRWDATHGVVAVGNTFGEATDSEALAISSNGAWVVGRAGTEAFRWDASSGRVILGDLPYGASSSVARAVSDDGKRVVGSSTSNVGQEAFIWTQTSGMQALGAVLMGLGVDLTGWVLREATDISADGRTIVGYGTNPAGATEAFVAFVPGIGDEPPVAVPALDTGMQALLAMLVALSGRRVLRRAA